MSAPAIDPLLKPPMHETELLKLLHPELWPRPEDLPDLNQIIIEDGAPVDGIISEKQMRLLTESLRTNWKAPNGQPFVVLANVGVYQTPRDFIVPDISLVVGIEQGADLSNRENQSYFVWLRGRMIHLAVEVVSNREGGEDTTKLQRYAHMRVPYYVIFDPLNLLRGGVLRVFELHGVDYVPVSPPYFFAPLGVGLTLWDGRYEDLVGTWLRWLDQNGQIVPTGEESTRQERERADEARERADEERERADEERERADEERERAEKAERDAAEQKRQREQAERELAALREQLRNSGLTPPG